MAGRFLGNNSRRSFLKGLASGCAAACLPGLAFGDPSPESDLPPNIIFILADDLGYGDLGCYGQRRIQTPCIDRLAQEGIRFSHHYAGSAICAPSRAALMTGLHTGHTSVRTNGNFPLHDKDFTVAQMLQKASYATGLIGKWGLGDTGTAATPNQKGFDYFFGYLNQMNAHNAWPEFLWQNTAKYPLANVVDGHRSRYGRGGVALKKRQYAHDLFTIEALKFIQQHRKQPFFLNLSYTLPHANNEAKSTDTGMEVPDDDPYTRQPWPQALKNYAAMITRMDRDVGRIMKLLKNLGIDERTLVIFTSDNGPHDEEGADPAFFQSAGPLRGIKRELFEGGIRVPLVARWPGKIQPASVSSHISAFWDFLPTAAKIAGIQTPGKLDGISYLPTLLGQEQPAHAFLYWECYTFEQRRLAQAVRMGDWKALRLHNGAPIQLYHLGNDIGEQHDLAAKFPDRTREAAQLMTTARTAHAYRF